MRDDFLRILLQSLSFLFFHLQLSYLNEDFDIVQYLIEIHQQEVTFDKHSNEQVNSKENLTNKYVHVKSIDVRSIEKQLPFFLFFCSQDAIGHWIKPNDCKSDVQNQTNNVCSLDDFNYSLSPNFLKVVAYWNDSVLIQKQIKTKPTGNKYISIEFPSNEGYVIFIMVIVRGQ